MAYIETPLLMHANAGLFLGGALGGTSFGIILAVIGRTVAPEKRSLAMGVATAAGSFGQFLLLPLTQYLISSMDWHRALLVLACVAALIIPLSLALVGRRFDKAQDLLRDFRIEYVKHARWRRPQPRELFLRELSCGEDSPIAQLSCGDVTVEVHPRLAIADCAHRGQLGMERRIVGTQSADFVDKTIGKHLVETLGDPRMQCGAV